MYRSLIPPCLPFLACKEGSIVSGDEGEKGEGEREKGKLLLPMTNYQLPITHYQTPTFTDLRRFDILIK
ncbi:hypothetical protein NIES2107_28100 [Nostoc carneum NIES-2107]|nr:hypothetical protein NIES2107_28100 [Nostoc carneum NIES-2107]